MISDSFLLAFKNLKHRGVRSWLTLLGIFIGVTAVVSLISLGNGLEMAVSSQFGIAQTELISIQAGGVSGFGPPGSGAVNPLTDKDFRAVERVSGLERVVKRYIASGKLEFNDKLIFGFAGSVPDGDNRQFIYDQLGTDELVSGRYMKDSDVKKVMLGYNFHADKTGLDKPVKSGDTILLNDKEFQVIGILGKQGSFITDNIVLMNEKDMTDLFEIEDEISIIAALPRDSDQMDLIKANIEKALRKSRDVKVGEEDFEVSTPEASLSTVKGILSGVQIFIVIVALISVFIGALGIVNTMTTSVIERKREIGIMKSIGARNEHIFLQFFIESGLLGLLGGFIGALFGTIIGVIGTAGINQFIGTDLAPNINIPLIFTALLGSFLIGAVAGIVPAMRASKQNPVDALRS